jgi:peptidoglycan/LPS O-acetylase OafA/YrhL
VTSRNQSLDVLRGIAVLLVIAFHLGPFGLFRGGFVGVDLFFALRGFLIAGLLFRDYENRGQIRLGYFWFRRAFKILPSLYAFLAITAPVMILWKIFPTKTFVSSVFFMSNYLGDSARGGSFIGHTWSLAIEEHFYLVFPIMLWLLIRHSKRGNALRGIPSIFVAIAVACFVFRLRDPQHWAFTHLRADTLFAGVTLRYFEHFRPAVFRRFGSPCALCIGLTFWAFPYLIRDPNPALRSFSYTWTALACTSLVGWCFAHDKDRWWRMAPLRALALVGFYSYSIYLWQGPLCLLALGHSWLFTAAGFVSSIVVGVIMARLVEFPALALRDRILTDRPKTDSPSACSPVALPAHIQS